jgi:hypothetical protein
MKKSLISVLVIGLLVFGLVLVGCDNGSTGGEEETGPKALTKVEIRAGTGDQAHLALIARVWANGKLLSWEAGVFGNSFTWTKADDANGSNPVTQAGGAFLAPDDSFFNASKYYQITVTPSIVYVNGVTPSYLYTGSATSQWFKLP